MLLKPAAVYADAELRIAQPPMSYFAPVPTYHDHIYRRLGVIVSYVVGSQYTQAIIDDSRRHEWQLIVSGNFTIEGRLLRCEQAPENIDTPINILCPDWPSDIRVYETPVYFTYWLTKLGDDEIAVLQSIKPA